MERACAWEVVGTHLLTQPWQPSSRWSPASRWHPGAAVPARAPPSPPCLPPGSPPTRLRLRRSGAGLGSPLLCQQCCGCPAPGLRLEPRRGPGFAQQPGRGDSTGPRCGSHVPCVAGQGLAPLLAHTGWRQRRCLHACFPPCPLILRPLSSLPSPVCPPAPSPSAPTPTLLTFHPHPPPRPLSRSPGGHRSHRPWQAVGEGLGAGRRPRGCLCPGLSAPTSFLLYGKAANFCRAKAGPCGFNGVVWAAAAGAQDPPGTSPALTAGCGAVSNSTRDAQKPGGVLCCSPGFAFCLLRGAEQLTTLLRASVSPLGVGPGGLGSLVAPHGHQVPLGSPARLE